MSDDPHIQREVKRQQESAAPPSKRQHDTNTSDTLLRMYLEKRIDDQLKFYHSRIDEFEGNIGFMVGIGALIMAISAVVSAVGATSNSPELALVTALLPALAALVAALRQLYQWEKQSSLYRDASLGLQEARLLMPDWDLYDARTAGVIFPALVDATEKVFVAEINQWGQIAMGLDEQEEDSLQQALRSVADEDRMNEAADANFQDGGVG